MKDNRTLKTLTLVQAGFSETYMSFILGVAPFLALFTVPMLGKMSDSCTSKYGRRRPFIFSFSIILVFSLLLLYIGQSISNTEISTKPVRMLLLGVGVVLLDYASQAAINPCEALVSDLMSGHQAESAGFTVYSGMLSVGACIGYLLTALDWSIIGLDFGSREQISIVLVLILYGVCFVVTMISARERRHRPDHEQLVLVTSKLINNMETTSDPGYESEETPEDRVKTERMLPRVTGNRIVLAMRRCGPGYLLTIIRKIIINVSRNKILIFLL